MHAAAGRWACRARAAASAAVGGVRSAAGAAGAGGGWRAGAGRAGLSGRGAAPPLPSSTAIRSPTLTLSPSLTLSSLITPAADDGISIEALSDSTVISDCSALTVSPGLTSSSMTATSLKSPMSGTRISMLWLPARCGGGRGAGRRRGGRLRGGRRCSGSRLGSQRQRRALSSTSKHRSLLHLVAELDLQLLDHAGLARTEFPSRPCPTPR